MPNVSTISTAEFEAAFRMLSAGSAVGSDNIACVDCEDCARCRECTFCVGSKGLARCHYCTTCVECVDCSHCVACRGCTACHHCSMTDNSVGCAYLIRSLGCRGCTYCFGCVGLAQRDFCILNEAFDRATYFEITSRLARELDRR